MRVGDTLLLEGAPEAYKSAKARGKEYGGMVATIHSLKTYLGIPEPLSVLAMVVELFGGIMVLILFGIMMTRKSPVLLRPGGDQRRSVVVGLVVAAAVFAAVYGVFTSSPGRAR